MIERREKMFGMGRPRALDRNAKVRIMHWARCLARRTEKGKTYGQVTAKALAVLEALLWSFHNAKSGVCFPSYERIAAHCCCSDAKSGERSAPKVHWSVCVLFLLFTHPASVPDAATNAGGCPAPVPLLSTLLGTRRRPLAINLVELWRAQPAVARVGGDDETTRPSHSALDRTRWPACETQDFCTNLRALLNLDCQMRQSGKGCQPVPIIARPVCLAR
jgi:hypothetical protein